MIGGELENVFEMEYRHIQAYLVLFVTFEMCQGTG